MSDVDVLRVPWRIGRSVGRTIYAMPSGSSYRNGEVLIGMVDTAEIAEAIVRCHNRAIGQDTLMLRDQEG